jgi:hypothetical protein
LHSILGPTKRILDENVLLRLVCNRAIIAKGERKNVFQESCPGQGDDLMGGSRTPLSTQRWLGVSDGLVGEDGQAVTDGAGVDEAHVFLAAGLAEEALANTEHERVDHQPQLVDEVVLYQRVHELEAGIDDDVPVNLSAQLRDRIYYVAC